MKSLIRSSSLPKYSRRTSCWNSWVCSQKTNKLLKPIHLSFSLRKLNLQSISQTSSALLPRSGLPLPNLEANQKRKTLHTNLEFSSMRAWNISKTSFKAPIWLKRSWLCIWFVSSGLPSWNAKKLRPNCQNGLQAISFLSSPTKLCSLEQELLIFSMNTVLLKTFPLRL